MNRKYLDDKIVLVTLRRMRRRGFKFYVQGVMKFIEKLCPDRSAQDKRAMAKTAVALYDATRLLEKRFPDSLIPVSKMAMYSIKTPYHPDLLERAAKEINRNILKREPGYNVWAHPVLIQYLDSIHRHLGKNTSRRTSS